MKSTIKYPYALPATFIWIGFLCAISFMEAWLKFQAPGVTISIGLGIGKLVFGALNKVEWFFIVIIVSNLLFAKQRIFSYRNVVFFIAALMTALETFWALPALDRMANLVIAGKPDLDHSLHLIYVGMELLKLICLVLLGIYFLKNNQCIENENK